MNFIKTKGVGKQAQKRLKLNRVSLHDKRAVISAPYLNGKVNAVFPVGHATYSNIGINIQSIAAIGGVTTNINGVHYVDSNHLADYIKDIRLMVNGNTMRHFITEDLLALNTYNLCNADNGFLWLNFPEPFEFDDRGERDAYSLGTKNLRTLTVELQLTAAWESQFSIHMPTKWYDQPKPLAWLTTSREFRRTFAGAGNHVWQDLPVDEDISQIMVVGDNVTSIKLEIDGKVVSDLLAHEQHAFNDLVRRDLSGFTEDVIVFDFWDDRRAGDSVSSRTANQEIRNSADMQFHIETSAATEVRLLMRGAGRPRP